MKKVCFVLAVLFSFMFADTASAQVPSIPRRDQVNQQQQQGVAWGTQYDWLSTRYATQKDIAGYDKGQIRVLKNSIYARHGRRFKDANLRRYFQSQRWYNPWRSEVPSSEFNRYESYNISFLLKYE